MPRKARKTATILNFPIQLDREKINQDLCYYDYEHYFAERLSSIQALNDFTVGAGVPKVQNIYQVRNFNNAALKHGFAPLDYDFGKWRIVARCFIIFGV